jgi:hypothetical protein
MVRQSRSSLALLLAMIGPAPIAGQDSNIILPVSEVEERFKSQSFEILSMPTSRGLPSERTFAPTVRFEDGAMLQLKFAPAPRGGEVFNNRPQYELAAYEIQKLFVDESDYVVPPTVARCLAFDFVEQAIDKAPNRDAIEDPRPTFDEWRMSLVVLQYWLWNIDVAERNDIRDRDRLEEDEAFARHAGNFNLLTYLIRHNDSNDGNFLISTDPANPRLFSVDNGLAFSNEESDRGTYWRELHIERFPAASVERLRGVTLEDLHATLGVVAQFQVGPDGNFTQVDGTENLDPDEGIRRTPTVLQLGLTASEIRNIHRRLTKLIEDVDNGKYEVF